MENLDVLVLRTLRDWRAAAPGFVGNRCANLGVVATTGWLHHGIARGWCSGRFGVRRLH